MITNEWIQQLIRCPKQAIKADHRKMEPSNRSLRSNIRLVSLDGRFQYRMFLRQSTEFLEDFSVGLIWMNAAEHIGLQEKIILIRFQGPHDSGKPFGEDIHHDYHIHEITAEDILQCRWRKPSNKEVSKSFSSFPTAIFTFVEYCGIIGLEKAISLPAQPEQLRFF